MRINATKKDGCAMDNWEEVKTAYTVGVLGTVTAASEELGVHRATVIRHIDSLEQKLDQQLFFRHTNGYTPTETCRELIRVVKITDEQFTVLSDKMHGLKERLSGELIVTSPEYFSPLVIPAISQFQAENPEINTRYIVANETVRLEYGEAHLAIIHTQSKNREDNVVLPFCDYKLSLYASSTYIEQFGKPETINDFSKHRFVDRGLDFLVGSFELWLREHVPYKNFIFTSQSPLVLHRAVINGIGIGFIPPYEAKQYPDLIKITPSIEEWCFPVSLVTHRNMHETEKVQKLIKILRNENYAH